MKFRLKPFIIELMNFSKRLLNKTGNSFKIRMTAFKRQVCHQKTQNPNFFVFQFNALFKSISHLSDAYPECNLPKVLCHGDLTGSNITFGNHREVVLINHWEVSHRMSNFFGSLIKFYPLTQKMNSVLHDRNFQNHQFSECPLRFSSRRFVIPYFDIPKSHGSPK